MWWGLIAAAFIVLAPVDAVAEETVKVGLILPMTGPFTTTGKQVEAGARFYVQQNGATVAGKKIEIILRDDAGVADNSRRIAQELLARDKVNVLAGFGLTPIALAVAPLATETRTPMVVMAAATAIVTEGSPYIVRSSFPQAAPVVIIADWGASHGLKKVATLVSDFAPGHDSETYFKQTFTRAGGEVPLSLRVPLLNPDFAPFLQRVRDINPDTAFIYFPGTQASIFAKQFAERGLGSSGIKIIGPGDLTDDDGLNGMGDQMLGMITSGSYSAAHDSVLNRAYVAAFEKANGFRPNFVSVGAYDGLQLIYEGLKKTNGNADGDTLLAAIKGMAFESPRGPISIDAETRDIVQNIYIRKVEKVNGALHNIEFATYEAVKDPMKPGGK